MFFLLLYKASLYQPNSTDNEYCNLQKRSTGAQSRLIDPVLSSGATLNNHTLSMETHWLICGSCGSSLVSLEVFSPAQILLIVQTTDIRHSSFLSSLFSNFFILEFKKLLFFSHYFLFSSEFFLALSCFLFKSASLLFLFSYYSILLASSFCSITIQFVLCLLFAIF